MSLTSEQTTVGTPISKAGGSLEGQGSPLPQLGLVCITASKELRFRAVTRKRLLQLPVSEQQQVLEELYRDNLRRLDRALDYCTVQNIRLYRMSSALYSLCRCSSWERCAGAVASRFTAGWRSRYSLGYPFGPAPGTVCGSQL